MPQQIDVPGQGIVEFPDGMTDDAIAAAIQRNSAPPPPDNQFSNLDFARSPEELGARNMAATVDFDNQARAASGLSTQDWAALKQQHRAESDAAYENSIQSPLGVFAYNVARNAPAAVPLGGRALLAGMADLATLYPGGQPPGTENIRSFLNDPRAPLPVEQGAAEMSGLSSIPTKAAIGGIKSVPAIGAAVGLGLAGAPASLAAGAPMIVNEQGNIDPLAAGTAALLPGVSRLGEKAVSKALSSIPGSVRMVLNNVTGQLQGRIVQKFAGVELSNDVYRKFLEAGGGAIAANAYLAATQTPAILALPPEQRAQAALDMVAGNLGPSVLAFASRPGEWSGTLNKVFKDQPELWQQVKDLSSTLAENYRARQRAGKLPEQAPPPVEPVPTVPPEFGVPPSGGPVEPTAIAPSVPSVPSVNAPPAPPAPTLPTTPNPGHAVADFVASRLAAGETLAPAQVRDFGDSLGLTEKEAGEWGELGATEVARDIARQPDMTDRDKFLALVNLYDRMPSNTARTVETKVSQQYSTPPALAWLGSVLADFKGGTKIFDPTAGHGMLLIGAPKGADRGANELDPGRAERLARFLGFAPGQMDATSPDFQ